MEHTKGPWRIANRGNGKQQLPVYGPDNTEIAVLTHGHLLDARLIAAAPELLEACKYAFENLKPNGNVKKDFSGHNAMAAISRAIAKAEGRS